MGCELISFHLIVRNDGESINHKGLRQLQTSHVKAHPLTIHTITGNIAWASTISHVCFVSFCTIVHTCMCVWYLFRYVCLFFINHMTEYMNHGHAHLFTINNLLFINSLLQEAITDQESRLYPSLKLYLML